MKRVLFHLKAFAATVWYQLDLAPEYVIFQSQERARIEGVSSTREGGSWHSRAMV